MNMKCVINIRSFLLPYPNYRPAGSQSSSPTRKSPFFYVPDAQKMTAGPICDQLPRAVLMTTVLVLTVVMSLVDLNLAAAAAAAASLPPRQAPCRFPAIYNFGDSNSDTGGIAAAFYPPVLPSGQTFFHRPAGRGSDGRLMIDFIAEQFGLPHVSAYLDSIESSFRQGANFATGGATIRRQNESWFLNGVSPFSLDIQIAQYNQFKARTTYLYNNNVKDEKIYKKRLARPKDFSEALYVFDIGQNDLAAGFRSFNWYDVRRMKPSIPDIVDQLAAAVQQLYWQGARTFWIHNTGPVGCLPFTVHGVVKPSPAGFVDKYGCVIDQNEMALDFNLRLQQRVLQLRRDLPEAALTYVDLYAAKHDLLINAQKYGFKNGFTICCGADWEGTHLWCGNRLRLSNGSEVVATACEDPSKVVSWDGVHYTEAANRWIVNRLIDGSFSDVPLSHACHRL